MTAEDLTEQALRARASLTAANDERPVPAFRAPTPARHVGRWAAPALAALAAVAVAVGAIWVGDRRPGPVVSPYAVTSVAAGQRPVAVATDGSLVWIADAGSGRVLALDATTLVERWSARVGSRPVALARGLGSLWVLDAGGGRLLKLDSATGRITGSGRTSLDPVDLTVSAGSVWVLSAGNQTLDRYDPDSVQQVGSAVLGAPGRALAAAVGAVWVSVPGGLRRVATDTGSALTVRSVQLAGEPIDLSADERGRLWVAVGDKTLVTIDAATGRVAGRVALSARPTAVAAAGTAVIVATADGVLQRFDGTGAPGARLGSTGAPSDALATDGHLVFGTSRANALLFATEITP